MKRYRVTLLLSLCTVCFYACQGVQKGNASSLPVTTDSIEKAPELPREITVADLMIEKHFSFDKYLLEDSYPYRDTLRYIQWDKIKKQLLVIEQANKRTEPWAIMQNYKNLNGEAKLVKNWHRNSYGNTADSLSTQRYQSVPLYAPSDTVTPVIYGRDGTPAHLIDSIGSYYVLQPIGSEPHWWVPKKYITLLDTNTYFSHVVVVDTHNQNITTLEQKEPLLWYALSTNPATTGRHKPPYAQETPLGTYVIQQKKRKMLYLKDGSHEIAGYAPYASRFTNGAYIHGVPLTGVHTPEKEFSPSLGTTPRSHMCVRNATSHAKFVYEWAPTLATLVVVIGIPIED